MNEYISKLAEELELDPNSRYIKELLNKVSACNTLNECEEILTKDSRGVKWTGYDAFIKMSIQDKIRANLITNETWMNRFYPDEMSYMISHVFKSRVSPLKILSLPSSHGDEAISIALLLEEHVYRYEKGMYNHKTGLHNYIIHGFDVQQAVVDLANSRTTYDTSDRDPTDGRVLKQGIFASINPIIREKILFKRMDVFSDPIQTQYNVIICRNFLGYFQHDRVVTILNKLMTALTPGGYLILDKYIVSTLPDHLHPPGRVSNLPIFIKSRYGFDLLNKGTGGDPRYISPPLVGKQHIPLAPSSPSTVSVSFLNPLANINIEDRFDLGKLDHSRIIAADIPVYDMPLFTLEQHGVELMYIPIVVNSSENRYANRSMKNYTALSKAMQLSKTLPERRLIEDERIVFHLKAPLEMEIFMRRWYKERFGVDTEVRCVRNMLSRAAGVSNTDGFSVPANNIVHSDYYDPSTAYDTLCGGQEIWPEEFRMNSPPRERLLRILNVWIPVEDVKDYPLGFLMNANGTRIDHSEHIPIKLVVGTVASSMTYKDRVVMHYKKDMKVGEAFVFESYNTMHASFRITDQEYIRRSLEIRCLFFSKSNL